MSRPPTMRREMDEKGLVKALKNAASGLGGVDGVEVHDWPFEEDTDKAFYVETDSVLQRG